MIKENNKQKELHLIVATLSFFVYDLVLFSVIRVPSLKMSITSDAGKTGRKNLVLISNVGMLDGIFFGVFR